MKKISKLFLLLALIGTLLVCGMMLASAEDTALTEGYYTYTVTDGEATIADVDTAISGAVTTPTTLGGYPVTAIGAEAFYHCSEITSIVVSEGIEIIGNSAFKDVGKVDSVTLPDSLTTLGAGVFELVEIDSITIPKNVSDVVPSAFMGCYIKEICVDEENPYFSSDENGVLYNKDKTELLAFPSQYVGTTFTVPETVKKIGDYGICLASHLQTLILPETLEELGKSSLCFLGIKEITLPASLVTITEGAFDGMFWLEEVIVAEDNPNYSSEDGVLFNKDKTELIFYPEGKTDVEYTVPATVTKIEGEIYAKLFLRKIIFQSNVEMPSSRSSNGLVTDIVFEEGVTEISDKLIYAYGYPKNVHIKGMNVEMPKIDDFKTYDVLIGDPNSYAEESRELYVKIYGTPCTEAEMYANAEEFNSKYRLDYYKTPELNAKIICHYGSTAETFARENGVPYSTTDFYDVKVDDVTYKCINCESTRSYEYYNTNYEKGFEYFVKDGEAIILEADYYLSGYIIIPETLGGYPVTTLPSYMFQSNNMISGVTIPATVTSIGKAAFNNVGGIISISVDKDNPSYTSVNGVLFDKDKKVLLAYPSGSSRTSYTVPDGVVGLGQSAFYYSNNLKSITLPDGLLSISNGAFSSCSGITEIIIPDSVISIGESAFNSCDNLTSIVIPEKVTSIGDMAFYHCSNLENVTIPDSVTTIGYSAFYWCPKINNITIPKGVVSIGKAAFDNCSSLESITVDENNKYYSSDEYGVLFNKDKTTLIKYPVASTNTAYTIPDTVTSIEKDAFYGAENLVDITVSDNITSIGIDAFHSTGYSIDTTNWEDGYLYLGKYLIDSNIDSTECIIKEGTLVIAGEAVSFSSNLTSVTFNDGLKTIGDRAFFGCGALTSVEFPDSITDIGYEAFGSCSLTSVTFGNGIQKIGDSAFQSCAITGIVIPDSIVSIGDQAFAYCENLADITINTDNLQHFGANVFVETPYLFDKNNWKDEVCILGNAIIACNTIGATVNVDENIRFITFEIGSALSFNVDENNQYYSSDETGSLFNKDKTKLIAYNMSCKNESYTIPDTVKEISEDAFAFCMYLKSLTIPESVEKFEEYAIESCISLRDIYFMSDSIYPENSGLGVKTLAITVEDEVAFWEEYWSLMELMLKFENGELTEEDFTEEEIAELESRMAYIEENLISNRWEFSLATIHCHEGSLAEIYALSYGVDVEYAHFYGDWSYDWENYVRTAKCIHCDETTTEALEKAEDTENEVEIVAPATPDTEFVVENIAEETDERYALVVESLESYEGEAAVETIYDITLENSEGVSVQPDGTVQVKLPVAETHSNYKVFRVNDDGTYTDMNATVVDGYVIFETDHFSLYVVVDTSEKACEHEFDYTKSEANLTRPTSTQNGYYTYTCTLCGATETEEVKIADYTEYRLIETRLGLIIFGGEYPLNVREKVLADVQAYAIDYRDDFIESEQYILDAYVAHFAPIADKAENCIAGKHLFTKYNEETAPKCDVDGIEKSICDYCGAEDERTIPALTHQKKTVAGKAPTCTVTGLTDGVLCTVCGETLIAQQTVDVVPHTEVTDKAVAATCTKTGLTEGKHCSVCGKVTVAQQTVGVVPHNEVTDSAVAATCTKTGLTEGKHCSVCGKVTVAQQTVGVVPHNEVTDKAVAATCTKTGLTEGKHCSVCGKVTVKQQKVGTIEHKNDNADGECDSCGKDLSVLDTSNCSCNCHKSGFMGFIYKIQRFFWKLFKMNRECSCGIYHY